MNGVTILSECVVRELQLAPMIVLLFILALVVALTCFMDVLIFVPSSHCKLRLKVMASLVSVIVVLFVGASVPEILKDYQSCYTEYKVTIDDSVSFNEFTSCYEILKNYGGVYTVRERTSHIQTEGNQ